MPAFRSARTPALAIPQGSIPFVFSATGASFIYTVPANRKAVLLTATISAVSGTVAGKCEIVCNPQFDSVGTRDVAAIQLPAVANTPVAMQVACYVPVAPGTNFATTTPPTGAVVFYTIAGYEESLTSQSASSAFRIPFGAIPIVRSSTVGNAALYTVQPKRKLVILSTWGSVVSSGTQGVIQLICDMRADPNIQENVIAVTTAVGGGQTLFSQTPVVEVQSATVAGTGIVGLSVGGDAPFAGFSGYEIDAT